MNKKILIIPILTILLISLSLATLTYDQTIDGTSLNGLQPLCTTKITTDENFIMTSGQTSPLIYIGFNILDDEFNLVNQYNYTNTVPLSVAGCTSDGTYIYIGGATAGTPTVRKVSKSGTDITSYTGMTNILGFTYDNGYFYVLNCYGDVLKYDDSFSVLTETMLNTYATRSCSNLYRGIASASDNTFYITKTDGSVYEVFKYDLSLYNTTTGVTPMGYFLEKFGDNQYATDATSGYNYYIYNSSDVFESEYTIINGVYYSPNQCIDTGSVIGGVSKSYILCNSSTMQEFTNSVVAYCDGSEYETICSGECLTTSNVVDGITYVNGGCDQSDCTNECLTIGSSKSVGLTSYQVCGQYDNDICLEYSGTLTCDSGEVYDSSSATYCSEYVYDNETTIYLNDEWYVSINSESQVLTTETTSNNNFLSTYLQITKGITANFNPLVKNIYYWDYKSMQESQIVETINQVGLIDFGTFFYNSVGGNGFVSYDCEANYNNLVISESDTIVNDTLTITNSLTGLINTVSIAITPTSNATFNYYIARISPSIEETITFNIDNQTVIVTNDGVTLLNQTFSSDIEQIFIYSDIDYSNGFIGHKFIILESNGQENIFLTNPKSFTGTPVPASNQISFSTDETITFNGYSVSYSNTQREGFEEVTMNTFFGSCLLNNNQNQVLRVYYNNENIPSYIDFKDVFLNVNIGGGVIDADDDNSLLSSFDNNLSVRQKYLLAIVTSIAFFILTLFIGSNFELNSTATSILGVVAGVSAFLFFVIIGWLPVYVAIVSFIIAGGVGAVFIRKQIVGV